MAEEKQPIFFSYSREDSEFALRLARDVKSTGTLVWLDQLDISPGARWDRATEAALVRCPRVVVILSPSSVRSDNVMDEVSFALEQGKLLIPILFKDCEVPFRLRRVQYVDFRKQYETGITDLCRTLGVSRPSGGVQLVEERSVDSDERVGRPPQFKQEGGSLTSGIIKGFRQERSEIDAAKESLVANSNEKNDATKLDKLDGDSLESAGVQRGPGTRIRKGDGPSLIAVSEGIEETRPALRGRGVGHWIRRRSALTEVLSRIGIKSPPIPNWALAVGVVACATLSIGLLMLPRDKTSSAAASGIREVHAAGGLSATDRAEYYHLSDGTELIPFAVLVNLVSLKTGKPFIQNMDRFGFLADVSGPANPRGLPIGMSLVRSRNAATVGMEMVGFNCAACHVGEITYHGKRLRVDGASSLVNFQAYQTELTESLEVTLGDPRKLLALILAMGGKTDEVRATPVSDPILHSVSSAIADAGPPGFAKSTENTVALLRACLGHLKNNGLVGDGTQSGAGRMDTFGQVRNLLFPSNPTRIQAPVKFPLLSTVPVDEMPRSHPPDTNWLQFDGSTNSLLERSIAQAVGIGLRLNPVTYESTLRIKNLNRLDALARGLRPPKWPADVLGTIDKAKAQRGEQVFNEKCADCHQNRMFSQMQVGTDPNRASSFEQEAGKISFLKALAMVLSEIKKRACDDDAIGAADQAGMDPNPVIWRATAQYLARPLRGIWANAPYLHNGSVPTLYDLLHPEERPTRFAVGNREFNPVKIGYLGGLDANGPSLWIYDTTQPGNSNIGHKGDAFGTLLTEDQKSALLEYLRTL